MAQDYNIYIRSDAKSFGSDTRPKAMGNFTKPKQIKEEKNNATQIISSVGSFVSSPDSAVGAAKGAALSAVGKAGIIGAIIVAAIKVTKSVTDKATDLYSFYTGDYSGVRQWNEVKSAVGAVFSPISSVISYNKWKTQIERNNERAMIQQQLLGDSQISQTYNRKV